MESQTALRPACCSESRLGVIFGGGRTIGYFSTVVAIPVNCEPGPAKSLWVDGRWWIRPADKARALLDSFTLPYETSLPEFTQIQNFRRRLTVATKD